jgi:hypothetical protein
LEHVLQLSSDGGIKPTLFLTDIFPLARKLLKEKKYDLGSHSNFKKLLNGDGSNRKDAADVLRRLMTQFPGVDVVRSHSLTTSPRLKVLFRDKNFSVESSFITYGTRTKFPNFWTEFSGITHVSITWEDDVWSALEEGEIGAYPSNTLQRDALNVLTFHAIHLYLNTANFIHYNASRYASSNPRELI